MQFGGVTTRTGDYRITPQTSSLGTQTWIPSHRIQVWVICVLVYKNTPEPGREDTHSIWEDPNPRERVGVF